MSLVNYIVDRYHVATPVREIMRDRYRKLSPPQKRGRQWRAERHKFWRAIIKRHTENRAMYSDVIEGNLCHD